MFYKCYYIMFRFRVSAMQCILKYLLAKFFILFKHSLNIVKGINCLYLIYDQNFDLMTLQWQIMNLCLTFWKYLVGL